MMIDKLILTKLSPTEILGLTIIGEARGEPIEGQVAVGSVIRNRLHHNPKYTNYNDVCLARNQFSCWNENDPNYPFLLELAHRMIFGQVISDVYFSQCLWVAEGIADNKIADNTHGSQFYMTTELFNSNRPKWATIPINDPETHGRQTFFNI